MQQTQVKSAPPSQPAQSPETVLATLCDEDLALAVGGMSMGGPGGGWTDSVDVGPGAGW